MLDSGVSGVACVGWNVGGVVVGGDGGVGSGGDGG